MLVNSSSRFFLRFIEIDSMSQPPVVSETSASCALCEERALAVVGIKFYFISSIDDHFLLGLDRC